MTDDMRPHIVIANLGTPTAPTEAAVREFLGEFLSDPEVVDWPGWIWKPILRGIVLRRRPARVAHQYQSIWTDAGSPLRAETERIVAALAARAAGRFGVSSAYRYGEPSFETTLRRIARDGSGPVVVTPLFPQRTGSTTGTAWRRARDAATIAGLESRVVERLIDPCDSGYVDAMAARWHEALARAGQPPDHVVISFHGIPVRYDRNEGHTYTRDCEATTACLLKAIDWPRTRATLAYQSKFGPERWLEPSTALVLEHLPRSGVRRVAVFTPGFLTDGLETIEEIGIRGRATFLEAGGEMLIHVAAVADHPRLIDSLVRVVIP